MSKNNEKTKHKTKTNKKKTQTAKNIHTIQKFQF